MKTTLRFLADMGVSQGIVQWHREEGYDAVHLREMGWQTLPNGLIFEKALIENRIVITFDLDFGEIVALSPGGQGRVILFRVNNTRTTFLIERLSKVLPSTSEALVAGSVVVVEDARHRIRRLPPGT